MPLANDPGSAGLLELAPGVHLPAPALRVQTARGSGPGGQNVNKVNTKVEIWVPVALLQGLSEPAMERLRTLAGARLTLAGDLHLVSEIHRSQRGNREEVMDRLRELLLEAKRVPRKRRATKPSRAYHRHRVDSKVRRGAVKALRKRPTD